MSRPPRRDKISKLDSLAKIFADHDALINEGVLDYDELAELDKKLKAFYSKKQKPKKDK